METKELTLFARNFPGVLETPLSNKRFSYHLLLLVIKNVEKRKKSNKFNRLQIEVFFLPNIVPPPPTPYISSPNIGPTNSSFVCIYAQGVITGFYGICFLFEQRTQNIAVLLRILVFSAFSPSNLDPSVPWSLIPLLSTAFPLKIR